MRLQATPLQPTIEQFNEHLDALAALISGTSLGGLPLHRLRDDADRQAEYAVALVSRTSHFAEIGYVWKIMFTYYWIGSGIQTHRKLWPFRPFRIA